MGLVVKVLLVELAHLAAVIAALQSKPVRGAVLFAELSSCGVCLQAS
jgi:hypothetical protein